jgi:sigma-B regulation protein RsbU (phosphoserine phosphatase)
MANQYNSMMSEQPEQHMQCMEVWGGSQLTARGVAFGGLDAWVYSKPHADAEHGGDVYYASSCATGRIARLLLADVAGHGTSVASTAADLRTLMRRFVNRLDQAEFVRLLNQQFTALSKDGAFATAVVTTFFEPSKRLMVCNAGHPRPLLYRAALKKWDFLGHGDQPEKKRRGPSNLPLGLIEISEYDQFDIELEPGDRVLSYTDALMESNDASGEMLGEQGVLDIVRLLGDVEASKVTERLLAEIAERFPENLTDDDVTVLLIQVNERKASYTVGEKLKAISRFMGTFVRSMNPKAERAPFPDLKLANMGGAIIPALARRWRAKPGGV